MISPAKIKVTALGILLGILIAALPGCKAHRKAEERPPAAAERSPAKVQQKAGKRRVVCRKDIWRGDLTAASAESLRKLTGSAR